MNKNEYHGNAQHTPTVADQLTGVVKYGTTANVIDDFNRVWSVETKHSGFILNGINHEGHIPYWSSYKLNLPNLRLFEVVDPADLPDPIKESNTVQEVIDQCIEADGYHFVDNANMLWEAKKCEYTSGHEIHDLYDNAWLPWVTCKVISIPGFRLIQTKAQVEAVKDKWKAATTG